MIVVVSCKGIPVSRPKVFLSYSHADSDVADKIARHLDKTGIDYFRDTKDIGWGGNISDTVANGITTSSAVIVILSPASLKSHWVPFEVGHASSKAKHILPYLTHSALASDLPDYLRGRRYVSSIRQMKVFLCDLAPAPSSVPPLSGLWDYEQVYDNYYQQDERYFANGLMALVWLPRHAHYEVLFGYGVRKEWGEGSLVVTGVAKGVLNTNSDGTLLEESVFRMEYVARTGIESFSNTDKKQFTFSDVAVAKTNAAGEPLMLSGKFVASRSAGRITCTRLLAGHERVT